MRTRKEGRLLISIHGYDSRFEGLRVEIGANDRRRMIETEIYVYEELR